MSRGGPAALVSSVSVNVSPVIELSGHEELWRESALLENRGQGSDWGAGRQGRVWARRIDDRLIGNR